MSARKSTPPLRAVRPDEKPESEAKAKKPERLTVTKAIESGERDLLVALRGSIARDIDNGVPAHALAGLTKQLLELDKSIRAIDLRMAEEAQRADGDEGQEAGDEAFDTEAI